MINRPNDDEIQVSPELMALGITASFVDEEGPPVDQKSIRRLLDGTLDAADAGLITGRISSYRSWFRACGQELIRAVKRNSP